MLVASNTSPISNLAIIGRLKPEVEALRTQARFFVSPQIERKILDLVGE